jgi:hypothetical protein
VKVLRLKIYYLKQIGSCYNNLVFKMICNDVLCFVVFTFGILWFLQRCVSWCSPLVYCVFCSDVFRGVHLWCVVVFAAMCFVVFSFGVLWFFAATCFVDCILVTLVLVASVCGLPEDCVVYISSYS